MLELVTECFLLVSDWVADHLPEVQKWVTKVVTDCFVPVWDWVIDQLSKVREWITGHPYATAAIIAFASILIFAPGIMPRIVLDFLGFGIKGITRGSIAAHFQSLFLGGFIPPGSIFAFLQSAGATLL
ncbi:hypothetical protein EDC04DRAFT_2839887 [Pisolithus marmoratus]|nr:hypothetical protein EDC04DRAFT_2839887 [Pisolithus marmoratus]